MNNLRVPHRKIELKIILNINKIRKSRKWIFKMEIRLLKINYQNKDKYTLN